MPLLLLACWISCILAQNLPTIPGDPLGGSGQVVQSIPFSELSDPTFQPPNTINTQLFGLPDQGAQPTNQFSGSLRLVAPGSSGNFRVIYDLYGYGRDEERRHLPPFEFEFVQSGSHIVPVRRGLQLVFEHPFWDYIIGPGRCWDQQGDQGFARCSLPFTLNQRNENCVHNGVLTFAHQNGGTITQVRYQIDEENCAYFFADFWGQLGAEYTSYIVPNSEVLIQDYAHEVSSRFPVREFSELRNIFPDINLALFGIDINPDYLTNYGLIVDGVDYTSRHRARYGTYPFPEHMIFPSYSTSKSLFSGIAMMALGEKYGSFVYDLLIKDYIDPLDAVPSTWANVTFKNALDLATGHYQFAGYMSDEGGFNMQNFFLSFDYVDKLNYAFNYRSRVAPGTFFNYHTSDTFIATLAMEEFLKSVEGPDADIFEFLVKEVYIPLDIQPGAFTTRRTIDSSYQKPFGGYGLFWTNDDIAKLTTFLYRNGGRHNGTPLVDTDAVARALQRDPSDRGLATGGVPGSRYNFAFWANTYGSSQGYECEFWVPYASGFGGIRFVDLPNGMIYYYYSDGGALVMDTEVRETHRLRSHCV